MTLTDKQSEIILKVWKAYVEGGDKYVYPVTGHTQKEMDSQRLEVIPVVKSWLEKYLNGSVTVEEFKTEIDEINRKNLLWGFYGTNGQTFLDTITRTCSKAKLDHELNYLFKETLPSPVNLDFAVNNIRTFIKFLLSLYIASPELKGTLKVASIPYFLSYFWQIQKPTTWPIYYTSMVTELNDLGIWSPSEDVVKNYSEFYELNYQMTDLIEIKTGKEVSLWNIEHAFWASAMLRSGQAVVQEALIAREAAVDSTPIVEVKPVQASKPPTVRSVRKPTQENSGIAISDSYVPPVVAVLPGLAANDARIVTLCAPSGASVESVFAERLAVLFKMLGYETNLPGQGRARVPEAVAVCSEFKYAILFDGEIRQQGYTLSKEEPALVDTIIKNGDRLRKQGYRTVYFMVISSKFNGETDHATRALKLSTGVNEVILVEVDALLALLESKLRDPGITLGPKHIQKLLAASGLLTIKTVKEFFGA